MNTATRLIEQQGSTQRSERLAERRPWLPRSAFARTTVSRLLLATACALLTTACGGGGPPDQTPQAEADTMTGHGTGGATTGPGESSPSSPIQVSAKAASGPERQPPSSFGDSSYKVSLSQLTAPYMLTEQFSTDMGDAQVYTVATQPGVANITPLTSLIVAQLFGDDPATVYAGFGSDSLIDTSIVTQANIDAAQASVVRYLRSELDFAVPQTSGNFITTPFEPRAGDPIYDSIVALKATLDAAGLDFPTLTARFVATARRCRVERLQLTIDGVQSDFCPSQKSALPAADDATVTVYRFGIEAGAVLTVSVRGSDVVLAHYVPRIGDGSDCTGAACSGIALGTPAGDGSRTVSFQNARLTGSGGDVLFSGTLTGSVPGYAYPTLSCQGTDTSYSLAYSDYRVQATCVHTDADIGGNGSGELSGPDRVVYVFSGDGSTSPSPAPIEVRLDGDQVHSVLVRDVDPVSGESRGLYLCRGTACNGVRLTASQTVTPDGFSPQLQRGVVLDKTVLIAVNADGTPASPSASVVVSGSFTGSASEVAYTTADCASAAQRLILQSGEAATPLDICPPATLPEAYTPDQFLNATGSTEAGLSIYIASLYQLGADPVYPQGDDGGVRLTVASDGSVSDVVFVPKGSQSVRYSCGNAGCEGVTVSAPDQTGARVVRFGNTVLREVETGGLPGDRSVTIDGAFDAPPPM